MAETGCLRNASYHHVSVQGNLNAADSNNIKNLPGVTPGQNYSLRANDCGTITLGTLSQLRETSDGGFNVYLPRPSKGLKYKFILLHHKLKASTDITIQSLNDSGVLTPLIVGSITKLGGSAGADHSGRVPKGSTHIGNTITFKGIYGGEDAAVLGDSCELFCDGTNWFMEARCIGYGQTLEGGSITLTSE